MFVYTFFYLVFLSDFILYLEIFSYVCDIVMILYLWFIYLSLCLFISLVN